MNTRYEKQKKYWEHAGRIGYGSAMFSNRVVERHIVSHQWDAMLNTAAAMGIGPDSKVLDLGCGDGSFAETALSLQFSKVDAYDVSATAIERARQQSRSNNVAFHVADLASYEFTAGDHWDAAFMKGFLHHVRSFAPDIIDRLAPVCPKIVLLEPNGDNLIRKLLELTPSYTRAGEDSFTLKALVMLFRRQGYGMSIMRRMTLMPPFLPERLFPIFKRIEPAVERSPVVSRLCSTYVIGFERTAGNL